MSTAGVVVAVDVGGTKIAATTVDRDGRCGQTVRRPTPAAAGPDAVLGAVTAAVVEAAAAQDAPVRAIGIGTAGVVDARRGVIVSATDVFPGWPGTPVADEVASRVAAASGPRVPVVVQNDVDAYAVGEGWRGAARGSTCALVLAVGTGVGGAVLLDGRPWRGTHHLAGEIGHMPVPGAELLPCTCGRPGHLEAVAAGPAVHRRYLALGGDPASPDTRDVVARAAGGDARAHRALTDAARALGRAVAGVATVLDPDVVVVGGGLAQAGDPWWRVLDETVRAEVVDALAGLPLRPAVLGGSAPLVGAARTAWLQIDEDEGDER